MAIQYRTNDFCSQFTSCGCPDVFGCPSNVTPDFVIRRHDTKPEFRVNVADCGSPLDLEGLILEVNMWAKAKLKTSIQPTDTIVSLADGIGFEQAMTGDVIIMDRSRNPEHMLVTGFDEDAKTITVTRGWNGTTASSWKKGTSLRIFRVMNSPGETEMVFNDVEEVDGTVTKNVLQGSYFIYPWKAGDTCLSGCYWLEFKLLKMKDLSYFLPGGHWTGAKHKDVNGSYLTGSGANDGSVPLSLKIEPKVEAEANDGDTALFLLPHSMVWTGPVHLWSDNNFYTGTEHTDASVYLNNDGLASDESVAYNDADPVLGEPVLDLSTISTTNIVEISTTSFTQCGLGAGVEWVRRFPREGDGFLVKISESPTAE